MSRKAQFSVVLETHTTVAKPPFNAILTKTGSLLPMAKKNNSKTAARKLTLENQPIDRELLNFESMDTTATVAAIMDAEAILSYVPCLLRCEIGR